MEGPPDGTGWIGYSTAQHSTLRLSRARSLTLLVCVAENSRVWRWRGMLETIAFRVTEKPCKSAKEQLSSTNFYT
jgi:hypothetical protein